MRKLAWKWILVLAMVPLFSIAVPAHAEEAIDVAIALDTSGSMEPLVDEARLKLWEIVNDLVVMEPTPRLRLALLTYGNPSNDRNLGWVRIETPLTTDLDLVSERLFKLECSGGDELVSRVLKTALDQLDWEEDSIRLIFVAGNEPADQDKALDFRSVGIEVREKKAALHMIYCGRDGDPDAQTWKDLAEVAGGHFATIDYRAKSQIVETPFDKEVVQLGEALNRTFVPLGEPGVKGKKVQATQDNQVKALSLAAAATRVETKASPLYARDWDLLDAVSAGRVDLQTMAPEELPEAMHGMTPAERQTYVNQLRDEREELRQRILELSAKRRAHLANLPQPKGSKDSRSFDSVVRQAIQDEMKTRGLRSEPEGDD